MCNTTCNLQHSLEALLLGKAFVLNIHNNCVNTCFKLLLSVLHFQGLIYIKWSDKQLPPLLSLYYEINLE